MATKQKTADGCSGGGGGDHHHGHEHGSDKYDGVDMAYDPTLASCCEKDAMAFDRAMELKSYLTAHDPSTQNVRMRQDVVLLPPQQQQPVTASAEAQAQQAASAASAVAQKLRELDIESDDSDSDVDFDDDFDELLASRRQELAAQFEQAARNAADGYGILLESDFPCIMKELKTHPAIPRVVFVGSSRLDVTAVHEMQQQMLAVANRFVGTKFYCVTTSAKDSADQETLRELRLPPTTPSVVAFRRGQRVDASVVNEKDLTASASILWEAKLVPWLTMCNVLETVRQDDPKQQQPQGPKTRPTSVLQSTNTAGEEELAYDCGTSGCRIRFAYEHEHVGPSQESKKEISAWRT